MRRGRASRWSRVRARRCPSSKLGEPVTFVLGAEREGLPDDVVRDCDEVAHIPQSASAESLNVAVAGAVALYELRRAR